MYESCHLEHDNKQYMVIGRIKCEKVDRKRTFMQHFKNDLKEKDEKEKEDKKEETIKKEIALTEEDIYNIVETLYNFDLKMLDKSSYILDIEKNKIELF